MNAFEWRGAEWNGRGVVVVEVMGWWESISPYFECFKERKGGELSSPCFRVEVKFGEWDLLPLNLKNLFPFLSHQFEGEDFEAEEKMKWELLHSTLTCLFFVLFPSLKNNYFGLLVTFLSQFCLSHMVLIFYGFHQFRKWFFSCVLGCDTFLYSA